MIEQIELALIKQFDGDMRLVKEARKLYPIGEEQQVTRPYVTLAMTMAENVSAFQEHQEQWEATFTIHTSSVTPRTAKRIAQHLLRVFGDQVFSCGDGVQITGMWLTGSSPPERVEDLANTWQMEVTFGVFVDRATAVTANM